MAISPQLAGANTRRWVVGLLLAIIVILLAAGALLFVTLRDSTPGEDSAEAGFLRDMQVHHHQAVTMAMIARDRTGDEQIRAIATDIAFTQTSQIGTMLGYLDLWELRPSGDDPAMTWMGHPTDGLMPGMATDAQIEQLRTMPVDEADTLFLQLMNRHHIAGVDMAEAIVERSDQQDLVDLAQAMIRTQNVEIDVMNQFLQERGEEPVTPDSVEMHTAYSGH